jgi:ABC-type glycerol-3-phosphate transport system substrate-binding protein
VLDGENVIHFAHASLDPGTRGAFDALIERYEELNPGVNVIQFAIPPSMYAAWARTRMLSERPPDLIEIAHGFNYRESVNEFVPLTNVIETVNPYNEGTVQEDIIWRNTFRDGMETFPLYNRSLDEFYAMALSSATVRMFYNVDLWEEIFGTREAPSNFQEFVAACETILAYEERELIPIAAGKTNWGAIFSEMFTSQTQRMTRDFDWSFNYGINYTAIGFAYFNDEWSLETEAVRDGLDLIRQMARYMPIGFMSFEENDALFYFSQRNSVMLPGESRMYSALQSVVDFPVSAFKIPTPSPEHPTFGKNSIGPMAEGSPWPRAMFSVARRGKPEKAFDFLRFLTSVEGNTTFMELSKSVPSNKDVEPIPELVPLLPDSAGYVDGFRLHLPAIGGRGEAVESVVGREYHNLISPKGGVDTFISNALGPYSVALRRGLKESIDMNFKRGTERLDPVVGALYSLTKDKSVDQAEAESRFFSLLARQNRSEADRIFYTNLAEERDL